MFETLVQLIQSQVLRVVRTLPSGHSRWSLAVGVLLAALGNVLVLTFADRALGWYGLVVLLVGANIVVWYGTTSYHRSERADR